MTVSVTSVLAVVVLNCLLEVPLLSHWYMIYKEQMNISVTAHYFTDTTVANKSISFISLVD